MLGPLKKGMHVNHLNPESLQKQERIEGPAYRIVTSRLIIRCWKPDDAELLKIAADSSTSHLRPWMPWATIEPTPLESRIQYLRKCRGEFDLGKDFTYGIFDREEKEVVGGTGLHTRQGTGIREIGYWIKEQSTRKGYATEAASALTKVAFEIDKVTRVEIHCAVDNYKSAAVPRKLGYVHEGNFRNRIKDADGKYHDSMIWTMLIDEYANSMAAKTEMEAYDVVGRRIL
jgi:RimJ/RimL family protein N-acetyltransferase